MKCKGFKGAEHTASRGQRKRLPARVLKALHLMAEWTGLEPATPGVTGRYSNQLNYRSAAVYNNTWQRTILSGRLRRSGRRASELASPRGFEPLYSP